jgi:hypothetical protein
MRNTRRQKASIVKGEDNPELRFRVSRKKKKERTFLESCKRRYNLLKPHIIHVSKGEDKDIICSYPSKGAKLSKEKNFTCLINSERTTLHKIVYHVSHNIESLSKDTEIYHTCGDGLCCRPSHLKLGPKGSNSKRQGCKGFIKLNELDSEDEHLFIKVCKHDPPCRVVTKLKDLTNKTPGNQKHVDCPGRLKYKGNFYCLCKKGCCKNITKFTDDMICSYEDVDTEEDDIDDDNPDIPLVNYFKKFDIDDLEPIDDESDSESDNDKQSNSTKRVKDSSDYSNAEPTSPEPKKNKLKN